jgi:hypothetical protein
VQKIIKGQSKGVINIRQNEYCYLIHINEVSARVRPFITGFTIQIAFIENITYKTIILYRTLGSKAKRKATAIRVNYQAPCQYC